MKHNEIELEDWKDFAKSFPLYEQLRNKTIGITGATGLLGSCMVHCLEELDRQHGLNLTIACFVRNEEKAQQVLGHSQDDAHSGEALGKNIIILKHDFSKTEEMPQEVHIDYLVHFASPTASQYFVSKPVETMMTDFDGTAQLLRFALRQNTASIVNVSSLEVYGSIYDDSHPLSEEEQGYIHLSDTRSSYPVAKRAAECLCHAYAREYGVHVKTARLAQTFGAGVTADDNRVFAQFARNIIAGEDIVLHTTGELSRCYCYTIDAIEAILFILLKGEDGEAYNVANESTYISIIDMAKFLCKTFNPDIQPVIQLKEGMGYSPMTRLRLSCSKVHQLGWTPRYDMKTMFQRLITSLKAAAASH